MGRGVSSARSPKFTGVLAAWIAAGDPGVSEAHLAAARPVLPDPRESPRLQGAPVMTNMEIFVLLFVAFLFFVLDAAKANERRRDKQ